MPTPLAAVDPRVDAYIAKAAPYARPILEHLRKLVHRGCPKATETIKWGAPAFDFGGPLCSMAAFKEHCAFGFWKGSLVFESAVEKQAMGQFGRISSLASLPPDEKILGWIKKGAEINARGEKVKRPLKHPKKPIPIPEDLGAALNAKKHAQAAATWETLPPSGRRDYLEWITEAKSDATREKHLTTTLEWLAEGKPRNWKYMKAKSAEAKATTAKRAR